MTISITEQRELADYIARKLYQEHIASRTIQTPDKSRAEIASVVWGALEDYTASDYDNGPDILHAHKAAAEAL